MIFLPHRFLSCLGVALCFALAFAQPQLVTAQSTPPAASPASTPSQWLQLETTYQNELKKIHVPLLSDYVNDLQRLAASSSNAETTVAIGKELQYVQSVINSGGVIDLTDLATGLSKDSTKPRPTPPNPRQATNALLVLTPIQATTITPPPASTDASADAFDFTSMAWLIEALPKGHYEIIVQCTVAALPTAGTLDVSLGKNRLSFPLEKRHLAPAPDSFRLLKLGTLELLVDIKDTQLEITAPKDSQIKLRQLLITLAKPEPPKSTPPTTP